MLDLIKEVTLQFLKGFILITALVSVIATIFAICNFILLLFNLDQSWNKYLINDGYIQPFGVLAIIGVITFIMLAGEES